MREEYVLKRVTELREERHWSLYRLAKESDISYSTLSNTFQRNNVPSIPTMIRVCDGFGITLSQFFDEGGMDVKQLSVADQKLLAEFHRLPRDDKKLVIAYMQGLLKITAECAYREEDEAECAYSGGDEAESADRL